MANHHRMIHRKTRIGALSFPPTGARSRVANHLTNPWRTIRRNAQASSTPPLLPFCDQCVYLPTLRTYVIGRPSRRTLPTLGHQVHDLTPNPKRVVPECKRHSALCKILQTAPSCAIWQSDDPVSGTAAVPQMPIYTISHPLPPLHRNRQSGHQYDTGHAHGTCPWFQFYHYA